MIHYSNNGSAKCGAADGMVTESVDDVDCIGCAIKIMHEKGIDIPDDTTEENFIERLKESCHRLL